MNFEEFCNYIKSLDENMTIGIHGIGASRREENIELSQSDIANEIMNNGFKLYSWGGALSSVFMFGQIKNLGNEDLRQIYNYIWQIGEKGEITNILFGFPEIITNSNGDEFYLGHFPKSTDSHVKGDEKMGNSLPLNNLFDKLKYIPSNFIIGCIKHQFSNSTIKLESNSNFYEFNNTQAFYDALYQSLENNKITKVTDYLKYKELYDSYGIHPGIIVEQYQEYLDNHREKTN